MTDHSPSWDLPRLDAFVEATLRRMAENRDVMSDEAGEPYYVVLAAGEDCDGTLRIDLDADLSGICMPTNAPLTVAMDPQDGPIGWFLEDTLIAETPRHLTPAETGDQLGMDKLLAAFGRWLRRGNAQSGPRLEPPGP